MRKFIYLVFATFSFFQVEAQKPTLNMKYVEMPAEYFDRPRVTPLTKSAERIKSASRSLWVVYSDRDNNDTYMEPKEGAAKKTAISFKQMFYVTDETDEWIRICEYDEYACDKTKKIFTKDLKDYGWVSKKNMLLWRHALIGDKGYTKKCMAINKFSNIQDYFRNAGSQEKLNMYNEPKSGVRNGVDARLMTFLFVYDEEGDYYLIGKNVDIDPLTIQDGLLGWIKKDVIQLWEQRLALEPDQSEQSRNWRRMNDYQVRFFENKQDATNFKATGKISSNIKTLPYTDNFEKMKPGEYRFPIIQDDGDRTEVYRTGVISAVYDENGEEVFDVNEQYEITNNYEELRNNKSKINVVFVVDGNEALKSYLNDVNRALAEAKNQLETLNASNNYSYEFGAVVYRNTNEKSCGNELRTQKITSNFSDLTGFLKAEGLRESCGVQSEFASMFEGLDAGLKMISNPNQQSQTNIIVLIGAQGADENSSSKYLDDIKARMAKSRIGFMAIQLKMFETDIAYSDFQVQVGELARQYQNLMRQSYAEYFSNKSGKIEFKDYDPIRNLTEINYPDQAAMPCFFQFANPGEPIRSNELALVVNRIIIETAKSQQELFAMGDQKFKGIGERRQPKEAFFNLISQMNFKGMTNDEKLEVLNNITDKNLQFFFEGYASVYMGGAGDPVQLFTYVILLDNTELGQMLTAFELLGEAVEPEAMKESIASAYKSQLTSLLGPLETKRVIQTMSLSDIDRILFGIPKTQRKETNIKLADLDNLTDPNVLSAISDKFRRAQDDLGKWRQLPNSSFISGSREYYWVPEKLLPR